MEDINLDEYELVPAIYFSQRSKPTIMITAETVLLNDVAVKKMNNVEYVQFMLNAHEKMLLVKSCDKNDEGATAFKTINNKPRKIKNRTLTKRIFGLTKWDDSKKYRAIGYFKQYKNCLALYFDISVVKQLPLKQTRKTNIENQNINDEIIIKF